MTEVPHPQPQTHHQTISMDDECCVEDDSDIDEDDEESESDDDKSDNDGPHFLGFPRTSEKWNANTD